MPDATVTDLSDAVVVIANAGLGQAEPGLSQRMLGTWLRTVAELRMRPRALTFYTAGVTMVAGDSPVLSELRALAQIVQLQAGAAKVVTL